MAEEEKVEGAPEETAPAEAGEPTPPVEPPREAEPEGDQSDPSDTPQE